LSPPRCVRLGVLVAAAAAVAFGCREPATVPEAPATGPAPARLVVLLAIDQLRPDRLSPDQPGGLGRLQREGRVFEDAALAHAVTETCPGHATMLSGRHPANIGVPGNSYVDPDTLEQRYCVEDPAPDAAILGAAPEAGSKPEPRDGRSPRVMRDGSLGDWMKARWPGARVFSVSGKDRSAIAMGGRDADAAYWLVRGADPHFTTSRYYLEALPDWVRAFDARRVHALLPDAWEYLPASVAASAATARVDDYPHESPAFGRAAPHPVLRDPPGVERLPEALRHPSDRAYATPFQDAVTLAFTRELVERENLGSGPQPDLLAVGLSATDLVGHFYGPESWESRDALARLDAALGELLAFLEARVGAGRLLVVVTADHGVLPIPEWLLETERSRCPLPGGRLQGKELLAGLAAQLDASFGAAAGDEGPWFASASSRITFNRARAAQAGVSLEDLQAVARRHLDAQAGVTRTWTRDEALSGAGPEPFASLYLNSWEPRIAGDLALQVDEDCLLSDPRIATSHGSPYLYDRRVPLVFFGPGVAPGRVRGDAATVDIAPTLAKLLGVETPPDLDGRVLDVGSPGS